MSDALAHVDQLVDEYTRVIHDKDEVIQRQLKAEQQLRSEQHCRDEHHRACIARLQRRLKRACAAAQAALCESQTRHDAEVQSLSRRVAELTAAHASAQQRAHEAAEALTRAHDDAATLRRDVAALQARVRDADERVASAEAAAAAQRARADAEAMTAAHTAQLEQCMAALRETAQCAATAHASEVAALQQRALAADADAAALRGAREQEREEHAREAAVARARWQCDTRDAFVTCVLDAHARMHDAAFAWQQQLYTTCAGALHAMSATATTRVLTLQRELQAADAHTRRAKRRLREQCDARATAQQQRCAALERDVQTLAMTVQEQQSRAALEAEAAAARAHATAQALRDAHASFAQHVEAARRQQQLQQQQQEAQSQLRDAHAQWLETHEAAKREWTHTTTSLRTQLHDAQTQLRDAQTQHAQRADEWREQRTRDEASHAQAMASLRHEHERVVAQCRDAQRDATEQLATLQRAHAAAAERAAATAADYQRDKAAARRACARWRARCGVLRRRAVARRRAAARDASERAAAEQRCAQLQMRLEEVQRQQQHQQQQQQQQQREQQTLADALQHERQQVTHLTAQLQSCRDALTAAQEQHARDMQRARDDAAAAVADAVATTRARLQRQHDDELQRLRDDAKAAAALAAQEQQRADAHASCRDEVAQLRAALTQRNDAYARATQHAAEVEAMLRDVAHELNTTLQHHTDTVTTLQRERATLTEQLSAAHANAIAQQQQHEQEQEAQREQREQQHRAAIDEAAATHAAHVRALQAQLAQSVAAQHAAEAACAAAQTRIDEMAADVAAAVELRLRCQHHTRDQLVDAAATQQQQQQQQEQQHDTDVATTSRTRACDAVAQQWLAHCADDAVASHRQMQACLLSAHRALVACLRDATADAAARDARVRERCVQTQQADAHALQVQREREVDVLRERVGELQAQLSERDAQLTRQREAAHAAAMQRSQLASAVDAATSRNTALQRRLAQLQASARELDERAAAAAAAQAEQRRLQRHADVLAQRVDALTRELRDAQAAEADATAQLQSCRVEAATLRERCANAESLHTISEAALRESQTRVRALREHLAAQHDAQQLLQVCFDKQQEQLTHAHATTTADARV